MTQHEHSYSCLECGKAIYRARIKVYCRRCHHHRGAFGDRSWRTIILSSLVSGILVLAAEGALRAAHLIPPAKGYMTADVIRPVSASAWPAPVWVESRKTGRARKVRPVETIELGPDRDGLSKGFHAWVDGTAGSNNEQTGR
ncbi:MAG: hypothetical protein P4L84_23525 [Isosphaeraceae bacterium]|nr:hypothetical protein [Isosphaeraceae bacterium]